MSEQESGKNSDGVAKLAHLFALRREELAPAFLGAAYFFFLLLSYYLLRPVRETFGISGGYENLPWLMTICTSEAPTMASTIIEINSSMRVKPPRKERAMGFTGYSAARREPGRYEPARPCRAPGCFRR